MLYAEIKNGIVEGIVDTEQAYPGGGWEIVRPILEDAGIFFVEITNTNLEHTHYNAETKEFYTPEEAPPEPNETEILQAKIIELESKLDAQSVKLDSIESTQAATIMAVMDIGMAVVPPPTEPTP